MENTAITDLESIPQETIIDNAGNEGNNQTTTSVMETAAAIEQIAEDTAAGAYEQIINAKDSIISAYEKQVNSLQEQITRLVHSGGVITDNGANPAPQNNNSALFQNAVDEYRKNYQTFADLGKEIGKKE